LDTLSELSPIALEQTANHKNAVLLYQLRWIAVVGQVLTIIFTRVVLGVSLPLLPMALVLIGLVALNVVHRSWLRLHADITSRDLFVVLTLDVVAFTAQLYLSGGATNPFAFLYLLQVALAAILLEMYFAWVVVALALSGFLWLTVAHKPLTLADGDAGRWLDLHILGTFICLALDAALLVVFATRIMRNLRDRDDRLAAMRQQAAEHDQIVRMGLLASGAAHELGTPLSSLSVILNDWRRMPHIEDSPDMRQELAEMQAALDRCKTIVTGILQSAGEASGEAASVAPVNAFLNDLVREWRVSRACQTLSFENRFGPDVSIVSHTALRQVIYNVLDNAVEASPDPIRLEVERAADAMVLTVSDKGMGFAPHILEQFGKPYQSTKPRRGAGLGLFLVVNVIRKLGGTVAAQNLTPHGARVQISIPLQNISVNPHAT
jgi:two-component system sensor histidine kinase RegB